MLFSQIYDQLSFANPAGQVFSDRTIHDIFMGHYTKNEHQYKATMQTLKGKIISVDHTYKVP